MRYRTIVADPPWNYQQTFSSPGSALVPRSAEENYKTMSLERICQLASLPHRLGSGHTFGHTIAGFEIEDDAFLFLWITNPLLVTDDAHRIVSKAWGFKPKQLVTWIKLSPDKGEEYWREHPRYHTIQVSSHGRIKSGGRILEEMTDDKRWCQGRWVAGYPRVYLPSPVVIKERVHVLVAETFLGPRPEGWDVDHIDSQRNHNWINNLEYVTRKENLQRAAEDGRMGGPPKPFEKLSQTPKAIATRIARSKLQLGMGHYLRNVTEQVVVATRGQTTLYINDHSVPNVLTEEEVLSPEDTVLFAPRTKHSKKPQELYDLVERVCEGPYLELFAREQRPGWTCWGDQL